MIFRARLAALALVPALAACARTPSPVPEGEEPVPAPPPIEQVVDRHAPDLMQLPGVSLVYVGATDDGRPCIRVGLVTLPHESAARIPAALEGWPVVVEEVGEIRPLGPGE